MNSSMQQLSEKLRQKQLEEKGQIQALIQSELTQLTQTFSKQLNAVLNTTLNATEKNLSQLKHQSQQLQGEYQAHQAANDQQFKQYMVVSGLFQLFAILILAGVFYGVLQPHQKGLNLSQKPQLTQAESHLLQTLRTQEIQFVQNRQGQPYLLLPKSEFPPHVRQHPNRPNQWLIPLNASSTRMPTQASSQATISSTSR